MILLGSGLCNSRTARKSVAVYNKPPRNNVVPCTNYDACTSAACFPPTLASYKSNISSIKRY